LAPSVAPTLRHTDMPGVTGVIDQFLHPPLGLLNPVLDDAGPYGPGTSTRTTFHTSGAFLLPSGTYDVSGTYGLVIVVNGSIPPTAGFEFGWDGAGGALYSGNKYYDRFGQIVVIHTLLSGAGVITQEQSIDHLQTLMLWETALPAEIGIWVNPSMALDLFYLCLL
jgi:hypothetical protein